MKFKVGDIAIINWYWTGPPQYFCTIIKLQNIGYKIELIPSKVVLAVQEDMLKRAKTLTEFELATLEAKI